MESLKEKLEEVTLDLQIIKEEISQAAGKLLQCYYLDAIFTILLSAVLICYIMQYEC